MSIYQRVIVFGISLALFAIGIAILVQSSLPDRNQFTGTFSVELGRITAPELNAIAPLFAKPTLNNTPLPLIDFRGKPVIINFWATWCEPCQVEMIELQRVYEEYTLDQLGIIGVNMGESKVVVQDWVRTMALEFDIVVDEGNEVADLYRIRGQPSTYILDHDGIIRHIFWGPVDTDTLTENIEPLIHQ